MGGRLHFLKARSLWPLLRRSLCCALWLCSHAEPNPPKASVPSLARLPCQFETAHVEEVLRFIESKGLHKCPQRSDGLAVVKATGGGASLPNLSRPFSLCKSPLA